MTVKPLSNVETIGGVVAKDIGANCITREQFRCSPNWLPTTLGDFMTHGTQSPFIPRTYYLIYRNISEDMILS